MYQADQLSQKFTANEVAHNLRISRRTLRRYLCLCENIRPIRAGRDLLFTKADVEALEEARRKCPLELIPPGKRKNNPFYLIRGTINGRDVEISTKTRDETAARIFKSEFENNLLKNRVPQRGEAVTFTRAAEFYFDFKQLSDADRRRIQRVVKHIDPDGVKLVGTVVQADLVAAANALYPTCKPETKDRWVIKPGAAIVHYAAENKWCAWERVKKFEEGAVATRASNDTTFEIIMARLEADERGAKSDFQRRLARRKQLFVLWLFRHWNRISEVLRVRWDHIDMTARTYRLYNSKGNRYSDKPIDDEVFERLANEPVKTGRIFSWADKGSVYKWLRPLVRELGVEFTPHMARHYGGKLLNRTGSGLKTIMGALDHKDAKSSLRYQDADQAINREAMARADEVRRNTLKNDLGRFPMMMGCRPSPVGPRPIPPDTHIIGIGTDSVGVTGHR